MDRRKNIHDLNYLLGKNYFTQDGYQNYLVLRPLNVYSLNYSQVTSWESVQISTEAIKSPYDTRTPEVKYAKEDKISVAFGNFTIMQAQITFRNKR